MITLKGAEISAKIKQQVQEVLASHSGPVPVLAIVRVGENPDDISYERGAVKKLQSFGLSVRSFAYPEEIDNQTFQQAFRQINEDSGISGILLLRPLPKHICESDIANMIDPAKDMDGISPVNIAKVFAGETSGYAPCTAEAVIEVLRAGDIPMAGRNVTIVGRSMVVGKPLAMLMLKEHATVTVCHTKTVDLQGQCRRADILVAAAGRARMLDETCVGQDAVVIDVGINVDEHGTLCGDVDFDSISGKASAATPVPGGVGTVTTAVLAKHLVRTIENKKDMNKTAGLQSQHKGE